MKRCTECHDTYTDEAARFCARDGTPLIGDTPLESSETLPLPSAARGGGLPARDVPSIAVLPFVNLSADADNEYFCDGLAEEILNALAKIEGLKVAARSSAFSFKGKDSTITEIGRALNVGTVLEGSVRKAGDRLRITLQLINVSDGYHLWSERYDRQMKDVFDLQEEVTLAVVGALKVKLLGGERAAVLKRYTDNTEAYELYLKGRYYYNKYTREGWETALAYFERAIDREPGYAPAFAGIALCRLMFWYFGADPPHERIDEWEAAALGALELDGDLAEAHLSLAGLQFYYRWDWESAEREYRRAVELSPNDAEARQSYGMFLASRGRFDEALEEGRRAVELDPLSLVVNFFVGWIFWFAGRFEGVSERVRNMVEIEPDFYGAYWQMGAVYAAKGMYEEAVGALRKSLALGGGDLVRSYLGATYGLLGRRDEALGVLDQLLEMRGRQYVPAFYLARVYSGLGMNDLAFEWLEKTLKERNGEVVYLQAEVEVGTGNVWGSIRHDPRFPLLTRRVGSTR